MVPVANIIWDGIAIFLMFAWSVFFCVHIIAYSYSKWKLHRLVDRSILDTHLPGVSILKPLIGVDPNLLSNIETFFCMDYPTYEIFFCVEDANDPATMLVKSLMSKYPQVQVQLLTSGPRVGVNPKINNIQPAYLAAQYGLVLISDASVQMRDDTLLDMVHQMNDETAIVYQMPFTCDAKGFTAAYEKVYFGGYQARMILITDLLGINNHVGMSSLIRRCALEEAGGLIAFSPFLAEDYFIARAIMSTGWKIRVASHPTLQNPGVRSVRAVRERLIRWAQLRLAMIPGLTLLQPLSQCLPLGVGATWAAGRLFGVEPLTFFFVHVLMWILSDWMLLCSVQNSLPPFTKIHFLLGWILNEFYLVLVLALAILRPKVSWHTGIYQLEWGGKARDLKFTNITKTY